MKLTGYIFLAFLALGLLAAITKAIAFLILGIVILAFALNPNDTFGCLAGLVFLGLIGRYPLPMILLSFVLVVFAIFDQKQV